MNGRPEEERIREARCHGRRRLGRASIGGAQHEAEEHSPQKGANLPLRALTVCEPQGHSHMQLMLTQRGSGAVRVERLAFGGLLLSQISQ